MNNKEYDEEYLEDLETLGSIGGITFNKEDYVTHD